MFRSYLCDNFKTFVNSNCIHGSRYPCIEGLNLATFKALIALFIYENLCSHLEWFALTRSQLRSFDHICAHARSFALMRAIIPHFSSQFLTLPCNGLHDSRRPYMEGLNLATNSPIHSREKQDQKICKEEKSLRGVRHSNEHFDRLP